MLSEILSVILVWFFVFFSLPLSQLMVRGLHKQVHLPIISLQSLIATQ